MSIDKVVIQGAEFTRVAGRYLLQTEVEDAMAQQATAGPHIDKLTQLLEDMVRTAEEFTISMTAPEPVGATGSFGIESTRDRSRVLLTQLRDALKEQIELIDRQLERRNS